MQPDGHAAAALWVVIPAFNEERWLEPTLAALAKQREAGRFTVLVVDNASTDSTAAVVEAAMGRHPELDLRLLLETEKGTGSACDTGFRHAIEHGAQFVLRTDADSLPDRGWVAAMRHALEAESLDLVGGRILPRTDDGTSPRGALAISALIAWCMRCLGRFNPVNRGPEFRCAYTLVPGFNLGVRAAAYLDAGGFPRSRIDDVHEDWEFTNRVRRISNRVEYRRCALVRYSNRRVARHGMVAVLRWYVTHGGKVATQIDVR